MRKAFIIFAAITTSSLLTYSQNNKEIHKLSLEELLRIPVYAATKNYQKSEDIPANVVVIDKSEIRAYGYKTLSELLENVNGMYNIYDYSENEPNLGVRGFSPSTYNRNMLITVNGTPQVNYFLENSPVSICPIELALVERIEIVFSPLSILYGSGPFYGVINIITDPNSSVVTKFTSRKGESIIGAGYGTNKTFKAYTKLSDSFENFDFSFALSLHKSNGPDFPYSDLIENPDIAFPLYGLSKNSTLNGKMKENEFLLILNGKLNDFELNCTINKSILGFNYLVPAPKNGGEYNNLYTAIGLTHKHKFGDFIETEIAGLYTLSNYSLNMDWYSSEFYGIQNIVTSTIQLNAAAIITPSSNLSIRTGFYFNSVLEALNRYDVPTINILTLENSYAELQEPMSTAAFFALANYQISENFRIIGGVRIEKLFPLTILQRQGIATPIYNITERKFEYDDFGLTPNLAAIYKIDDRQVLKLIYGQSSNNPSFFQYTLSLYSPGKNQLTPEKINSFDLNYSFLVNPNYSITASLFHNSLSGIIVRHSEISQTGEYITYFANEGEFKSIGLSVTNKIAFLEYFNSEISFSYQNVSDTRELYKDITVAFCPTLLAYMKLSYKKNDFAFGIHVNYVSELKAYWDESKPGTTGNTPGERIPGDASAYFLVGANLNFSNVFNSAMSLNLKCSNLLDSEIRYPATTGNSWATKGILGFGRTMLVTLDYNF